jgi:hypothetical protein
MAKAKIQRVPVHYKYERTDFLQCSCVNGKCPNYNARLCNRVGGELIAPNLNYFKNIKALRDLLQKDINISVRRKQR